MDINLLELSPDKRARLGLFLAFQYPSSVPGVTVGNFLRRALEAKRDGYDPNAVSRAERRRRRSARAFRPPSSASCSTRR